MFSCIDFFFQVITQMSIVDFEEESYGMNVIGFRKIWDNHDDQAFDFRDLIM